MALNNGGRYWGRKATVNPGNDRQVVGVNDPCVPVAQGRTKVGFLVGTNESTAKDIYAVRNCQTTVPQVGQVYQADKVMRNATSGKDIYAIKCQPCTCSAQIRIRGCSSTLMVGVPIEVYDLDDNPVASGVTNSSGIFALTLPSVTGGSYRVAIAAPDRYAGEDGVRTLACSPTINEITLQAAEGFVCASCCPGIPIRKRIGIEFVGVGTAVAEWVPSGCRWEVNMDGLITGSENVYTNLIESASDTSRPSCLDVWGGVDPIWRRQVNCSPAGWVYEYLSTTGTGRGFGFALIEDLGPIPATIPIAITIGTSGSGAGRTATVTVSTKALSLPVAGPREPDAGGCRSYTGNSRAWIDISEPTQGYIVNNGTACAPDYGTDSYTLPFLSMDQFATYSDVGAAADAICKMDGDVLIDKPNFVGWPYSLTQVRLFNPDEEPAPLMARASSPAQPSRELLPLSESLRILGEIKACPNLVPKAEGDPCGCMGTCSAGRGDMAEGRTSYGNCERCVTGESS